ncbi:DNA invertase [Vibrio parahaemolyticus]|uniref:recombinase family protein n=1 Tax=Vibrio parahaemolyticus TaxID=670 RepID=UPI0004F34D2A|nr:recombinase family protein [Vibrio parahaemolyticus]RFD48427.1 DNA invertase [Vibrio parahaemolyticus 3355]EGR0986876.1 recombinase family protein [Vibrio parahaemolyticus]EGR1373090.1 recombinase family protein [Vibrio parahaemolyticus]ELZ1479431.1 recombinase family protein [Vibrio parahaemolyticus]MCW8002750.1 DNA invertase [Vibrio parahaemolyticus]
MRIGYARVSTDEQDTSPQIDALKLAGCERIYSEHISGKSKERPELERLLDAVRNGDVVIVQRLDRLGRSLKDLIELLDCFNQRGIKFISLSENIDTTTATGELAFHMIGAIVQFERRLISERTKVGLAAARARGRKGGRKAKMSSADVRKAQAMLLDPTVTKTEVAEHFCVSRPTLNKYLGK